MRAKFESLTNLNRRVLLIAWIVLGLLVLIASQSCSTIWAFGNRSPHHWDNAMYVNRAWGDLWAYTNGGPTDHHAGVRGVFDSLMNADPYAPPAYRIVTAPFIFWGGRMLAVLRAVSLMVFWLTLFVIYRTGVIAIEGPAGRAAGIVSAMLVGMYFEVGWSIRIYGTEFTLYFATALLLYCLVRGIRVNDWPHLTWIGLGFALGLGLLSKVSFALLAGPPMVVALGLVVTGRMPGLSIWKLLASAAIATVIAGPFYYLHGKVAWGYAEDMTRFSRHSLHRVGWELLRAWAKLHVNEGMGLYAAGILGVLLGVVILTAILQLVQHRRSRRAESFDPHPLPGGPVRLISPASIAIVLAMSQGLVLPAYQLLFSLNNNTRHVTPAYVPLTLGVTLSAGALGALLDFQGWMMLVFSGWLAFTQLHRVDAPMTNAVDDAWDWAPLYSLVESHGIRFPMVGHVGNAPQFCDPFLTEPWESRGRFANSEWLWRSEEGSFDLSAIRGKLADRNVVVTAPDFHMPGDASMLADPFEKDNQPNTAFAQAMLRDPAWELAGKFPIGLVNRAEVWVFLRRK